MASMMSHATKTTRHYINQAHKAHPDKYNYPATAAEEEEYDLLSLLAELADGLKHGQHFTAGSSNGTLVWVGHVGHHICCPGVRQGQLWGQVEGLVPLPDACAYGL